MRAAGLPRRASSLGRIARADTITARTMRILIKSMADTRRLRLGGVVDNST